MDESPNNIQGISQEWLSLKNTSLYFVALIYLIELNLLIKN